MLLTIEIITFSDVSPKARLPVVIAIHAGGFNQFGGQMHAPDFLLNEANIIVVRYYIFLLLTNTEHSILGNNEFQIISFWVLVTEYNGIFRKYGI